MYKNDESSGGVQSFTESEQITRTAREAQGVSGRVEKEYSGLTKQAHGSRDIIPHGKIAMKYFVKCSDIFDVFNNHQYY